MDSKPWYLSKTILVQVLMGIAMIVAVFSPSAGDFIKSYFSEIGAGWAIVNVLLRVITKKEIA